MRCKAGMLGSNSEKGWDITSSQLTQSLSVAAQDTVPSGLFFKPDGLRMYVTGRIGTEVNEYTLSQPWSIGSAQFVQAKVVGNLLAQGLFFKPDGTAMYLADQNADRIDQFSLSSEWNISSLSFQQSFNVSAQQSGVSGVSFTADGQRMFIVGFVEPTIAEYSLSTAWDISACSFVRSASLSPYVSGIASLFIKNDGLRVFASGTAAGGLVRRFNLSVPYDISTMSYVSELSVSSEDGTPYGLFFHPHGFKMFVAGDSNNQIYEYALN